MVLGTKPSCQIRIILTMHCEGLKLLLFYHGATDPKWARASSLSRIHNRTQQCTTVGRTRLDEWSFRRRDLYLTTHNTHNTQTSMPLAGFESTNPASDRAQTRVLHRAATGIGRLQSLSNKNTHVILIYHHHHHHQHHHHLPPWIRSLDLFDTLASFPGASTISSSSRFVVEGVFRKSDVVHSFKMINPDSFVFGSHVLYCRDL